MIFKLVTTSHRLSFAFAAALFLHGLVLWGPNIRMPRFDSSLPPLTAKLAALPDAGPARPKPGRKNRPAEHQTAPEPVSHDVLPAASETFVAANEQVAASAPAEAETLANETVIEVQRPPLPKRAQLTFNIYWGEGGSLVGETVHTLEIDDGHYVLHAVTRTVGLTRLLKSYELTQYSSGTYSRYGLRPEQYFEERKESSGSQRNTVEFDRTAQLARFSNGKEIALPPETQDFLSNMYQFPPLQGATIAPVSVSNGKKVEHYNFEIISNEEIDTTLGKLLTVRLHKMHGPKEEGLDIWLAREYRLFPVKIRHFEANGEVDAEAVITDIRVSEEQGVRSDAVN